MRLFLSIISALLVQQWTIAQNSVSFDRLSFTEPANWTFADNGSYHTYLNKNYTSNIFCIISVYASDASSGNPEQDFRNEWKGIVSGHFTVQKNPSPQQNKSAGGISYLQDEAAVSNSNGNYFARLSVFSLKGKVQSILFLTGNKNSLTQYQPDLDIFLASLKPNNTENTNTTNTSTLANTSHVTSTNSELIHFNHFIFQVPQGWKATQAGDFYSMTPSVVTGEEQLIFLLFPPATDTSFKNVGNLSIKQLAASIGGEAKGYGSGDGSVYEVLYEGLCEKGWEYSMGSGTIQVNNTADYSKSMSFQVGVFLAKINGRIERVLYLSKNFKCDGYSTTTAYKDSYAPIIDNFFFDMEFDDWTDAAMKPGKITSSGISGVWSGVSYLGGEVKYDATFFILFDNGQVFYDSKFPKPGLYNLNTLSAAASRPDQWGTYTYQNGSGVMKISSWRTIPFSIKDGKLMATTGGSIQPFAKLPSIDGATLKGTWCFEGSCISFTSDGKFTDDGVIQKLEHLPSTCNFIEPQNGQGTYEIKNNSIFFHYTDGLTIQNAITGLYMENRNLSTNQLSLGWYNDVLQKKIKR